MWIDDVAKDLDLQVEFGAYNSVAGVAVFNKEHTERYILEKRWARGDKIFLAFLMNPSKASFDATDRTVTQMIELAKKHACDALYVINISSVIDADSAKLVTTGHHFSPENWRFIKEALQHAEIVFIGWGMDGQKLINQKLAEQSDIRYLFQQVQEKLHAYTVLEDTKEQLTYVPLPRNKNNYKKYADATAQKITEEQFEQLF
ncbi:MAG: DUF1643 domain-containing protein [Kurthia sp.]|nr:DUF1643 domain-containing protein [Candidatus Kurthia equi]